MSFETELEALIGGASDAFDIKAMVRPCYFYDIAGYPIRLWEGQGILTTSTAVGDPLSLPGGGTQPANQWFGTIDAAGTDHHRVPSVSDVRDGTSPRYSFALPYLDKTTFDALKADQSLVRGRKMTCYQALFAVGEGLNPTTAIWFDYRVELKGIEFSEAASMDGGTVVITRQATAIARSGEQGRSRAPGGTFTSTAQAERARQFGLSSDSGCDFVAANSRRTFVVAGG